MKSTGNVLFNGGPLDGQYVSLKYRTLKTRVVRHGCVHEYERGSEINGMIVYQYCGSDDPMEVDGSLFSWTVEDEYQFCESFGAFDDARGFLSE